MADYRQIIRLIRFLALLGLIGVGGLLGQGARACVSDRLFRSSHSSNDLKGQSFEPRNASAAKSPSLAFGQPF